MQQMIPLNLQIRCPVCGQMSPLIVDPAYERVIQYKNHSVGGEEGAYCVHAGKKIGYYDWRDGELLIGGRPPTFYDEGGKEFMPRMKVSYPPPAVGGSPITTIPIKPFMSVA